MCAPRAHIPGEGVTADRVNLIPSPGSHASARSDLYQPKSDLSDFGQLRMPNSGKPEFGWERCACGEAASHQHDREG